MFDIATKILVDAVGGDTLLPPPSLEEAIDCKPLALVTKARSLLGWQSVYVPGQYSFTDILESPTDTDAQLPIHIDEVGSVKTTTDFRIAGKVGSKITKYFNINVEGSSSIKMAADFGNVTRSNVHLPDLISVITKSKVQKSHPFIKNISQYNRNKFYIIVSTVYSTDTIPIQASSRDRLDQEAEIDSGTVLPDVTIGESVNMKYTVSSKFEIPSERTLAYKMVKVKVADDGSFKVVPSRCHSHSMLTWDAVNDHSGSDILGTARNMSPLFLTDKRYRLSQLYKGVISTPCCIERMLKVIDDMLEARNDNSNQAYSYKEIVDELRDLPVEYKSILSHLGITGGQDCVTNKLDQKDNYISSLLQSARQLLSPLSDLSDEQCAALENCNKDDLREILQFIERVKDKQISSTNVHDVMPIYLASTLKGLLDLPPAPQTLDDDPSMDDADSSKQQSPEIYVELASRLVDEAKLVSFILKVVQQLSPSEDDIDGCQPQKHGQ